MFALKMLGSSKLLTDLAEKEMESEKVALHKGSIQKFIFLT